MERRLNVSELTPDQRIRFDDLKALVAGIIHTYGLLWLLEAIIAHLKDLSLVDRKEYETRVIDNLTKTVEEYQARYENGSPK